VKLASINLRKLVLSPTGSINLGFILREDLMLCSSYLPIGVPNWAVIYTPSPVCVKKEPPVKTEVKDEPAAEEDKRPWWVKELMMMNAAGHPDDPVNVPGLHLLQARSFNEAQPLYEATAVMWSAQESGVIVDLTKDDDDLPPVKQEE
jgi:hypothetical protein